MLVLPDIDQEELLTYTRFTVRDAPRISNVPEAIVLTGVDEFPPEQPVPWHTKIEAFFRLTVETIAKELELPEIDQDVLLIYVSAPVSATPMIVVDPSI